MIIIYTNHPLNQSVADALVQPGEKLIYGPLTYASPVSTTDTHLTVINILGKNGLLNWEIYGLKRETLSNGTAFELDTLDTLPAEKIWEGTQLGDWFDLNSLRTAEVSPFFLANLQTDTQPGAAAAVYQNPVFKNTRSKRRKKESSVAKSEVKYDKQEHTVSCRLALPDDIDFDDTTVDNDALASALQETLTEHLKHQLENQPK